MALELALLPVVAGLLALLMAEVELELPFGVPLALSELVFVRALLPVLVIISSMLGVLSDPINPVGLAIPVPTAPLTIPEGVFVVVCGEFVTLCKEAPLMTDSLDSKL